MTEVNENQNWQKGIAPIKKEYLIPRPIPTTNAATDTENTNTTNANAASADQNDNAVKPQKQRGMNKKRTFSKISNKEKRKELCNFISVGDDCPYGENCERNHDITEFLANTENGIDIYENCPVYESNGYCKYGLKCKFHKYHVKIENGKVVNLKKSEVVDNEKNKIGRDVFAQLRKKGYEFSRTFDLLKKYKESKESKENNEKDVKDQDPSEPDQINLIPPETSSVGPITTLDTKDSIFEKKKKSQIFSNKTYLAPLTTVGNLPFRRLCKSLGVEITSSEMILADSLLKANPTELSLLKRHVSEDIFGIQICGRYDDQLMKCVEFIENECDVDFIDLNLGCPIDLVYKKGMGSGLLSHKNQLRKVLTGMNDVSLKTLITVKLRTGIMDGKNLCHDLIPIFSACGVGMVCLHGRSREQRYSKLADYEYIYKCCDVAKIYEMPFYGNGDILSYTDYYDRIESKSENGNKLSGCMIGRGALIKPWIFTEIKERRHYDISSSERFEVMKEFCKFGLEHWGSDKEGIDKTRRFFLEWHSFHCRYIPVGLLEVLPQKINERPLPFRGRDELETLLGSGSVEDWIKVSEMLLGKVSNDFQFVPKHKSNSYSTADSSVKG